MDDVVDTWDLVGMIDTRCYAQTGRSSRREVSWSGVGSGFSALATCDANMW